MFRIKKYGFAYYISDDNILDDNAVCLHSDGNIYKTTEYFPSKKIARTVLNKYRPKHVWKHGDIFDYQGHKMMYLNPKNHTSGKPRTQVVYILNRFMFPLSPVSDYLEAGKFLYNIKDKI